MLQLLRCTEDEESKAPAWFNRGARTRAIIEEHYQHLREKQQLGVAAAENVLVQLENLCTLPTVAMRLSQGTIHVHGWLYLDDSVFAYDPRREQFVSR
jgi:carbonic anhydrase